jgi:hypothetical protein
LNSGDVFGNKKWKRYYEMPDIDCDSDEDFRPRAVFWHDKENIK